MPFGAYYQNNCYLCKYKKATTGVSVVGSFLTAPAAWDALKQKKTKTINYGN